MSVLKVKILRVKSVPLEIEADMVTVPGMLGDIGITSGDRFFTYLLKSGIIYIHKGNKVVNRYFVLNGRFTAEKDELIITTEMPFYNLDSLDINLLNDKIADYNNKIQKETDEFIKDFYKTQVDVYNTVIASEKVFIYN
jgi:F0F1-type ATP synthase epsilon subunit